MPIGRDNRFKGRQDPGDLIFLCGHWYLPYPLSYQHVAEVVAERGAEVDASGIWRWVQDVCTPAQQTLPSVSEAGHLKMRANH